LPAVLRGVFFVGSCSPPFFDSPLKASRRAQHKGEHGRSAGDKSRAAAVQGHQREQK